MQLTTSGFCSPSLPRPPSTMRAAVWHARRLISYLTRGLSLDSVCLTVLAVLCELPVLLLRGLIVLVCQAALTPLIGAAIVSPVTAVLLTGLWVWAPLALLLPAGSGWWWKQIEGGRRPSQRERLAYNDSIEMLQAQSPRRLTLPSSWFVVDTPLPNAAVNGDALMLSRGALESEYLPAVIAHELGHLASTDGRLTAMLNRMLLLPPRPGRSPDQQQPDRPPHGGVEVRFHGPLWLAAIVAWTTVRFLLFLARGGLMLRLTGPLWGVYWREREYKADGYAANLGQADELADFLDTHALIHDQPIPLIWLTEHTHPPSELRIEKLRAHAAAQSTPPALPR